MPKRIFALFFSLVLTLTPLWPAAAQAQGQGGLDPELLARIRREANENSQIMKTLHVLTDIYGPRLTGSPALKAAGEWAIRQMSGWGLENGHLEPWDFGHPGWANERLTAHIVSPVREPLVAEVLAWTPGTNGTVKSTVYQLLPPANPTAEELSSFLEAEKSKISGKFVMVGKPAVIPVNFNPPAKRLDDAQAKARFSGAGPAGPPAMMNRQAPPAAAPGEPKKLNPREVAERIDSFLVASGATVRINDAAMEQRRIRAFNNRTFDPAKAVPTVVLSNEDYGRISRILGDGIPVELEFNIVNQHYPEGKTAWNVIAEIPGTDLRDEVIMLGGHLDSWHAATGATDNAVGCATMMEAARIIKALGLKPRRTIRVALWSGEEQGLLGSLAYVREHFGSFENQKPEYAKFGGYFNIDMGTGKARGMSVFGPTEGADLLRTALEPFAADGFVGAAATKSRSLGGSDHTSFNQAGLPGISVGQDPVEYTSVTWHTNLDTYERIVEDDTKKSAAIIAAAVYLLASRDAQLPRFNAEGMPALPAARP